MCTFDLILFPPPQYLTLAITLELFLFVHGSFQLYFPTYLNMIHSFSRKQKSGR